MKKNSMKGLINIKNDDDKCFLWCHVRHLNQTNKNPQRITTKIKNWLIVSIRKTLIFLYVKHIKTRLKKRMILYQCILF